MSMLNRAIQEYSRGLMKRRGILVLVWTIILGVNTWTENLGDLLRLHSIGFKWNPSPNYLSFFYFEDISEIHSHFIIVKIGHFIGFAIFDLLIFNWTRNHKWSLVLSISFAVLTEILQLFFGRDGRLYDVIIDSLGVFTVYSILKYTRMADHLN
jgi:hypothetical protein